MTAFRRLKPRAPVPDELWLGTGAFGVSGRGTSFPQTGTFWKKVMKECGAVRA